MTDGMVLDYSWERPDPQTIKAAGYSGVIRYASNEPKKDLLIPERDRLWAAGLSVGIIWETTARRPVAGFDAGREDARRCNERADLLGLPKDKAVGYAVDFDPTPTELAAIGDYFRGVLSYGGRPVADYGCYKVVEYLAREVPGIHCHWQCAAWSGRGNGSGGSVWVPDYRYYVPLSQHTCLFQFYGSLRIPGTDHNEVFRPKGHGPASAMLYHPDIDTNDAEDDDMTTWFIWEAHADVTDRFPPGVYLAFSHDRFVSALDGSEVQDLMDLAKLFPDGIKHQGKVPGPFWAGKRLMPRHPGDIENVHAVVSGGAPPVDVEALATLIVSKLDAGDGGSDVTADEIATAVADALARRLHG